MSFIKECPEGLILRILVLPRSSKNMIAGVYQDALKIKLAAPPVDGAANRMCIKFISKCFNLSKSSVEIISGNHSRIKTLLLRCNDCADFSMEIKRLKKFAESVPLIS